MGSSWKAFFTGDILIKEKPKTKFIYDDLADIIADHDIVSCNFETSIYSKTAKPIAKAFSPYEYMLPEHADPVKEAGFNIISMATNHMYDYGQEGLQATLDFFSDQITVGVGLDFKSTYELKTTIIKGTKIGFLSFCEAEFGALTDERLNRGGTAWINYPLVNKFVAEAKNKVDVLIIQVHAGLERTSFPLPEWRTRYKELIDLGADAIIGHHPHIPQGWEMYKGKPIFYSIGHFYFDLFKKHPLWDQSICVSLSFNGSQFNGFEIIPIEKTPNGVRLYNNKPFEEYLDYVCKILEPEIYWKVVDEELTKLWQSRYSNIYTQTINIIPDFGPLKIIRSGLNKINKKLGLDKYFIDNIALLHNLRIESHKWSVERALSLLTEKESYKDLDSKI